MQGCPNELWWMVGVVVMEIYHNTLNGKICCDVVQWAAEGVILRVYLNMVVGGDCCVTTYYTLWKVATCRGTWWLLWVVVLSVQSGLSCDSDHCVTVAMALLELHWTRVINVPCCSYKLIVDTVDQRCNIFNFIGLYYNFENMIIWVYKDSMHK